VARLGEISRFWGKFIFGKDYTQFEDLVFKIKSSLYKSDLSIQYVGRQCFFQRGIDFVSFLKRFGHFSETYLVTLVYKGPEKDPNCCLSNQQGDQIAK
jgi:hypothetical protein